MCGLEIRVLDRGDERGKREEVEMEEGEKGVEAQKGRAAKSGLIWRDEWECDFCGPECFCWTADEEEEVEMD
jgi:hypothetical protein